MSEQTTHKSDKRAGRSPSGAHARNLTRRILLGTGALLGLAALAHPTDHAYAWSSWTNTTSPVLKKLGMGDCIHEDLVQIAYARTLRTTRETPRPIRC